MHTRKTYNKWKELTGFSRSPNGHDLQLNRHISGNVAGQEMHLEIAHSIYKTLHHFHA